MITFGAHQSMHGISSYSIGSESAVSTDDTSLALCWCIRNPIKLLLIPANPAEDVRGVGT